MRFMGSKDKLAKYICPIIQDYINKTNTTTYIEPFVGGANVIDKIKCEKRIGYDINLSLIQLLDYMKYNPEIPIAPEDCSFEHYKDVRENQGTGKYTNEYTALIGYAASYAGRYFDGGFARDRKGTRNPYKEHLVNLRKQAPNLAGIEFEYSDYLKIPEIEGAVIYCDAPYRGVKQYTKQKINYDEYYEWLKRMSGKNIVLISEFDMPEDFECIWEKPRKIIQRSDRIHGIVKVEKLFVYKHKN